MTIAELINTLKASHSAAASATVEFILPEFPIREIGDKVFDMPSQAIQTIERVNIDFEEEFIEPSMSDPNEATGYRVCVTYSVSGQANPTGDGAFPGGGRNDFEVCDADKTLPLGY